MKYFIVAVLLLGSCLSLSAQKRNTSHSSRQRSERLGNPCPGTAIVVYAGKTYHTVQIGSQCWLRENVDVGKMIRELYPQTNNDTVEKYCDHNEEDSCRIYGGLYQWDEAMQYSRTPGTQGICPSGWHIPTAAEFETLIRAVGGSGNALKVIGHGSRGGAGTNTSGFSALLAGMCVCGAGWGGLGSLGVFWSSTEYDSTKAQDLRMGDDSDVNLHKFGKKYGFSVRCIKN
jgi:uncharacterized protein (TIGR02145 family)